MEKSRIEVGQIRYDKDAYDFYIIERVCDDFIDIKWGVYGVVVQDVPINSCIKDEIVAINCSLLRALL